MAPLEGLWSAADPEVFRTRRKSDWDWTMMIAQPEWITPEIVDGALAAAQERRQSTALGLVRRQPVTAAS